MKNTLFILSLFFTANTHAQIISMDIIEPSGKNLPGGVNKAVINNVSEPLKAIIAYYASLGGSNCDATTCELTTALGLGNQGSDAHIQLIQKYFKGDKTAELLIAKRCFLPSNTALTYTDYAYLRFLIEGNKVIIQYRIFVYNGNSVRYMESDNDEMWIEPNVVKVKKKKLMQTLK